ncbi:TIGR04222 domain-containing membrane protein [Micromonospora sp. C28SCA-DRY-2]|uniref:TIGR04222 domain-containing membrane protein n=1 Tax=Micromonospora sp. C28SCA-DRY-2 TaxID=3059522 RepID=UPI0026746009|nr:TIGR04222 domain-containing membrane protein [Micromonospora sp. C28SCA-DRY-2]MDO3703466.1 TIGR04222 domain-containing membrane protein [Micromonospora sp. C28SCA-DRY-2]
MSVLAAPGDTWGIPGPTFLRFYLAAAVLVAVLGAIHRARVLAGSRQPGYDQLSPEQAAYLNGGAALAVHATLGALRGTGSVGVGRDRRLVTTGPMPAGATPLAQAVHNAAGRRTRVADLRRDQWVASALTQLGGDLEQRGLALSPAGRESARRGAMGLLILLAVGVFRLFAGLSGDKPVGYLLLSLAGIFVAFLILVRAPYRTRAGRAALRTLRQRHVHLAPASSPAYATYGAAGAAMGVALFGTAALWAMDPGFAEQAEIQRQALGNSGGTGGCGGGSSSGCGGGSSCGGGGCGGGGCGG